ncbi:unnamed protein product [Sphagnum troendelagicum]
MTKLPLQCNMLQFAPPRRSRMFVEALKLKLHEPAVLTATPQERLHIWQRYLRNQEFNVLEDFYWFYEGWDIFNKRFMKSLGKVFPELLLERIYYHRIKLENFDVIQRALESQEDQELDAKHVIINPTIIGFYIERMNLRHFSQIVIQLQTFDPHELSACKKSFHC